MALDVFDAADSALVPANARVGRGHGPLEADRARSGKGPAQVSSAHGRATWMRWVRRSAATIAALLRLALILAWVVRGGVEGGLVGIGRLLQHGPPDIRDLMQYPLRELGPSPSPEPLALAAVAAEPPRQLTAPNGREATLAEIVGRTRTHALLVVQAAPVVFEYQAPGHHPSTATLHFKAIRNFTANTQAA